MTMKMQFLCLVFCMILSSVFGQNSKFCSNDDDCFVEGTRCESGLCICNVGQVWNTDGDKCLDIAPGIGSTCSDNTQCNFLILGSTECNNKDLCSCTTGHVFFNNKCVKYQSFNETCTEDTPCFDGVDLFALKCEGGKCVCNEGYYSRGGVGCRPSARADRTGECFFDIDCEDENMYCKYKLDMWGPSGKCTAVPQTKCEGDEDCKFLENSHCAEYRQTCFCNNGYDYDQEEKKCLEEKGYGADRTRKEYAYTEKADLNSDLNKACNTNKDCEEIKNSFCAVFRQKCTCADSFIYDKYAGHCVRGLGAQCQNVKEELIDSKCGVRYSTCNNKNLCQCPKYFIYSPYSDKCFKPTREFGLHSCGSDENCYSFGPHATCSKVEQTDLIATCNCESSSKFDNNLKYCVPLQTVERCKNDCRDKIHSVCKNNECICPENYLDSEGFQCLPNIGSKCSLAGTSDCVIENAFCNPLNKVCECNVGYFQNGARQCLKSINDPEEECEVTEQCVELYDEGGICIDKNCTCVESHILDEEENKCILKRNFGEQCTTKKHCQTILNSEHIVCRNGVCLCDYGYKYSEQYSKCLYSAASSLTCSQIILSIILIIFLFVN